MTLLIFLSVLAALFFLFYETGKLLIILRTLGALQISVNTNTKRLENQIMALKDDIKTGVARLIADNEKLLTAIQTAADGDGLTQAEAQDLLNQMNAASDKDEAALGGTQPAPTDGGAVAEGQKQ